MRLEITLKPQTRKFLIPINYNFPLSSAIYKIFESFSPYFSKWLHEKGFKNIDGKRFKFFTFSRLYFWRKELSDNLIKGEGDVKFIFCSPLTDTLIPNFINGLLEKNNLFIGNKEAGTYFKIFKVSILPFPEFKHLMKYKMLSPTISSIQEEINGKKRIKYLSPIDEKISLQLAKNLLNKYYILYEKNDSPTIEIQPDYKYINENGGEEKVMKLITIKEATSKEIKLKGFITPISIKSTIDIQKIAYFCGIGEKNSLGFGCLELI